MTCASVQFSIVHMIAKPRISCANTASKRMKVVQTRKLAPRKFWGGLQLRRWCISAYELILLDRTIPLPPYSALPTKHAFENFAASDSIYSIFGRKSDCYSESLVIPLCQHTSKLEVKRQRQRLSRQPRQSSMFKVDGARDVVEFDLSARSSSLLRSDGGSPG